MLSKTDWNDFKEPIVGTLIPNFFITYFGQVLPHGDISDDEFKAKLIRLGTGYELWANTANNAVEKLDDILSVMEEIKTPESIKKYFDPNRDAKSLPLATSNGPFGAMTLVQLDNYPVTAHVIKDLFQLSPQAVAPTLASYAPGNVMLHLPAKVDKESEAKKSNRQVDVTSHPWQHQYRGNIGIEYHSSRSIERDAGGSESALCSSSQSICRSRANDIRVGHASRLHHYPIDSDIDLGHVKDPRVPYASREFCNKEVYQS